MLPVRIVISFGLNCEAVEVEGNVPAPPRPWERFARREDEEERLPVSARF